MVSTQEWADAETLWEFHRMHHAPRRCDVLVGLGARDVEVAEVTAGLYHRGLAPLVVFTGGVTPRTVDVMPRGEAVHYRERAVALGVPEAVVMLERRAQNTAENIRFTRELLAGAGVQVHSVLLVSKPYEERRAHATAGRLWPEVEVVSASAPMDFAAYVRSRQDPPHVVDSVVGSLQRLLVYPGLGFFDPVPVPGNVLAAYERLCAAGFTGRLVAVEAGPGV